MERGRRYADEQDNLMETELRLGMPGVHEEPRGCKRAMPEVAEEPEPMVEPSERVDKGQESKHVAKAQVVGWPPIRSYRKNSFQARKSEEGATGGGGIYVKVSMDGAPYLRKIDLNVYKSYEELREVLEGMFKCFSLGDVPTAPRACCGSNYAVAYEDKDGDWMLVGDVPWRMFISSCKRLRIMKGSEARGLSSNS